MERAMRKSTARLKTQLAALGEEDLGKRDAWMFAPLLMVAAALPIAIVAIVSVSLYTHSGDRYGGTSFPRRVENGYTRQVLARTICFALIRAACAPRQTSAGPM